MPRTKVSKGAKRNREAALMEEQIREFNDCVENCYRDVEEKGQAFITEIELEIKRLLERTNETVLNELFVNILKCNVSRFSDCKTVTPNVSLQNSQLQSTRAVSGNDDGYITEESGNSGSHSTLTAHLSMTRRGRTPGPLNSGQVRRHRRSRSACLDYVQQPLVPPKTISRNGKVSDRLSRNKLRTPMSARPKAFSADRSIKNYNGDNVQKSPACAFLRWPKPGEFVVSVHGSPLVGQVMPDRFANVNIPVRDGVLSLRPKRLADLDIDIVEKLDDETLRQIETLHKNLDMIVSLASSKNFKENK